MAKKRALLVGINAYPRSPLRGCLNDILDMANFLASEYGFTKEDVRLIADARATRSEILTRLNWLTSGLEPGDTAFFMFSGHGTQMASRAGSGEVDRLDEVMCPFDFDAGNAIRDDDLEAVFRRVPSGVNLTIVSDSCHSEGLSTESRAIEDSEQIIDSRDTYFVEKFLPLPIDLAWQVEAAQENDVELNAIKGSDKAADNDNLVLLSGCLRTQKSADASFGGRPNGAFTRCLIEVLKRRRDKPLSEVIVAVRELLAKNRYPQEPQIEGGSTLMSLPFLGIPGGAPVKGKGGAKEGKGPCPGDSEFGRFRADLRKLLDRYDR